MIGKPRIGALRRLAFFPLLAPLDLYMLVQCTTDTAYGVPYLVAWGNPGVKHPDPVPPAGFGLALTPFWLLSWLSTVQGLFTFDSCTTTEPLDK